MKPNEIRVTFISDNMQWELFKLGTSRYMTTKDDGVYPASASDVLRELIEDWIFDHMIEVFPKILKDFQRSGLTNRTTRHMRETLTEYAEDCKVNKDFEDLAELRKSLEKAGFTKEEISEIIKEEEK